MGESRCISSNLAALSRASKLKKYLTLLCAAWIIAVLTSCSLVFSGVKRKFINYPIAPGDSLYTISQRFAVEVDEIREANDIPDERALQIGSILKIPYRGQAPAKEGMKGGGLSEAVNLKPHGASLNKVKLSSTARYIGKMLWPVGAGGGHLSSPFGWRWWNFHEGLDISAPEGTAVYAAHSGKVVYSGTKLSGYGKIVVIKGEGLITVYAHNQNNRVRVGDTVERGERIADLGMSGKATGPHLHFETRIRTADGKYAAVDPLVYYQKAH